ncbi:hypothetical protein DL93DRAFT_508117 [Clavulina sp. PMI_390]|nr:hypothetical protein DL93DRAFT_508117 [Clavulina sp. PMI_390]
MALWHTLALWVFHALYALSEIIIAVCGVLSIKLKQCDTDNLLPRAKLPTHLAVAFTSTSLRNQNNLNDASDHDSEERVDAMVECARRVMRWCGHNGILNLTVYDKTGLLKTRLRELNSSAETIAAIPLRSSYPTPATTSAEKSESKELSPKQPAFPADAYLTPPPSDESTSSSTIDGTDNSDEVYSFTFVDFNRDNVLSDNQLAMDSSTDEEDTTSAPKLRNRLHKPQQNALVPRIQVHVASAVNGQAAVAQAAQSLARTRAQSATKPPLTVLDLDEIMHADLAPPQLLIMHELDRPSPFTLIKPLQGVDMFPPWQLRLTEVKFLDSPQACPVGAKFF